MSGWSTPALHAGTGLAFLTPDTRHLFYVCSDRLQYAMMHPDWRRRSIALLRFALAGLPAVAWAKEGGKSGLRRAGRPGVVLGDFAFKREGRKVPQRIYRRSPEPLRGTVTGKGEKVV